MDQISATIVLAVNLLSMGALFHLLGRRMPADSGLRSIAAGSALFGSAYVSRLVSKLDMSALIVLPSDIAMVTAALLFLQGVCQFAGRSSLGARRILGLAAGYAVVATLTMQFFGGRGRLVLLTLTLGSIYGVLAWTAAATSWRIGRSLRAPLWALTGLVGVLSVLTVARGGLIAVEGVGASSHGLGAQVYYAYATIASALLGPVLIWMVFERLNGHLADLASRDELTRVMNRKGLDDALRDHFGRGDGVSVTWLQVDIDHFKSINDSHGHAVGDEILRTVAAVLRDNIRSGDFIARTGGEEFLVGCVGADVATALALAERLRAQVAALTAWPADAGVTLQCTVSIGVSHPFGGLGQWEAAARAADRALYAAKEAGRNRVVAAVEA
ncbi:MAG: GGDEF domain-containing protein [Burkholderiales bacterium]|nr:GGDEF domain-containing protein [Burkholderiales bacterium]